MSQIDKKEIQKRIKELREKIELGKENFASSHSKQPINQNKQNISTETKEFFYIFDGKKLLIGITAGSFILLLAYYLQIKTPLFNYFFTFANQYLF